MQTTTPSKRATSRARRIELTLVLLSFTIGLTFPIFVSKYGAYNEILTLGILMATAGIVAQAKLQHRRFWIERHPALYSVFAVLLGWAINTALRSL